MSQPKTRDREAYRFVVTYRKEPREVYGACAEWRGTVQRVPDALEQLSRPGKEALMSFTDLNELPEIIDTVMKQTRARKGRAAN